MARPKNDFETWVVRFAVGTKARIDSVLDEKETRADLVRHAVDRELKRRERAKPKG